MKNLAIGLLASALVLVLAKSNFLEKLKAKAGYTADCSQCRVFAEADKLAPSNAVVFLGDSHIARMQTDFIATPSLNYGIAGETLPQLAARVRDYQSISNARTVVIHSGINDVVRGVKTADSLRALHAILATVPTNVPVILSLVLPTAHGDATALNAEFRKLPRVRLADARAIGEHGAMRPCYDSGDGLHLNAAGMAVLGEKIRAQLH